MGNLYGYTDYDGPNLEAAADHRRQQSSHVMPMTSSQYTQQQQQQQDRNDRYFEEEDDDENDPLRAGMWMEGDSLAPPCGSSIPLIHSILEFGKVTDDDVMYDFGAGDGRVCLEALVRKQCRHCVGVELEEDLVEKGNKMIENLPAEYKAIKSAAAVATSASTEVEPGDADRPSPQDAAQRTAPRIQLVQADLRTVLDALVKQAATVRNDEAKLDELNAKTDEAGGKGDEDKGGGVECEKLPLPTVIVLYLLPDAIAEIQAELLYLMKKDCRIIFNTWGFPSSCELKPIDVTEVHERNGASTSLFLYTPECYERLAGFEYMLKVYNS
uniref:DOT1 domain-containing protein n=1 Tax=Craspedostauros australis TaxID=1486917 RepID=A0A7R9WLQ2_9STRA|mmetsp:Transcript_11022/g.30434  ORF Transcript_11022/g.30434 Transcript_11022/m.30434 type:complete len:327 (+) Transcript_11022:182-1162(+)|eukprot:CAMPEP_0198119118 /NCGR_PEP_ID=MMETSP1442-20131203/24339_1 /TAXON_ID= /ORGANISM="Craspedostauros australis, Strain CCMP3328" /LENGTH=326 /DNA_ID=CAMNT_0043777519 /DNA_START=135 /DNA_END=1115 /DNA_ORIENTATION=+